MAYTIEIRGSVRTSGKDDHWTGWEAVSHDAAHAELAEWRVSKIGARMIGPGDHVYIIGPDGAVLHHEVQPGKRRAECELDAAEFAMQQGMAFGIDAYNEACGY